MLGVGRSFFISNDSGIFRFLLFPLEFLEMIKKSELVTCPYLVLSECFNMCDLYSLFHYGILLFQRYVYHFHPYTFQHITHWGTLHATRGHAGDQIYFYL